MPYTVEAWFPSLIASWEEFETKNEENQSNISKEPWPELNNTYYYGKLQK